MSTTEVETLEFPFLTLQFEGPLATILLNDAERLNAMGEEMGESIIWALAEIAKPRRRCRAVLITATGRGFCAGVNLMGARKALADGTNKLPPLGRVETLFHPMLRKLHALQIPLIAGVNGLAIGIGVGMALAADYIVAADSAWFQVPFKNLASAPDSGTTWLLPQAIGPARTKRMLMRAERVDATTAESWGMISEVVPAEQLAARAKEVAMEFANDPTIALSEIKKLINNAPYVNMHGAMEAEAAAVAVTSRTKDNVAAIRVFGKKGEKPVFTGE